MQNNITSIRFSKISMIYGIHAKKVNRIFFSGKKKNHLKKKPTKMLRCSLVVGLWIPFACFLFFLPLGVFNFSIHTACITVTIKKK